MKKWILVCLTMLLVSLTVSVCVAEPVILTPQEQQILPVSHGCVTFSWVPQDYEMDIYVIDATQTVLFSQTVDAGVSDFELPVSGLLQEGQPYLLMLMIGDDSASAAFGIDMGGGRASNVDWSSGLAGSASSSSSESSDFRMVIFDTEGLEGLAKKLLELYNRILEGMSETMEGYTLNGSRGVVYAEGVEGALLNPITLRLVNQNGFFPYDSNSMESYTNQLLDAIASDYKSLKEHGFLEGDDYLPFSKRYAQFVDGNLPGDIGLLPLEFYNDQGVAFLLFALTDESGAVLLDENIYGHFCVADVSGKLISMLMTEQEEISKLLEELGLSKEKVADMLPKAMSLGFTQERLIEELAKLMRAGMAQKTVHTNVQDDFRNVALDRESNVGKKYARILWDRMDGVHDAVLDALIQEKTEAELKPNLEWQIAMYKGAIYELLSQNVDGIGEIAMIAAEYLKPIRKSYMTANHIESVNDVVSTLELPQNENWARLLKRVIAAADMNVLNEGDLSVIACLIAEQAANADLLNELIAAVGADSTLGVAAAAVFEETELAFEKLLSTLHTSVIETLNSTNSGTRIAKLTTISANAVILSDANNGTSTMSDVYALFGSQTIMDEMEASIDIGNRLIQLNLMLDELRALVQAAYEGEEQQAAALYTLTRLFLIMEDRSLSTTQSFFGTVENSWFTNTFAHEGIKNAKSGNAAISESRKAVAESSTTLREQRKQSLNTRQRESNAVIGRTRLAIVNTSKSPLTMTKAPEKKGGTICKIPKGATVTIIEEGEWSLVEYDGKQGYVDSQYLL